MQAALSHYRILEQIGAGGMGVVYRAHDERLDRDVAVKVLPPGAFADEAARKRFRKEALALSKLNHPNIATVHDFDTQEGTDFLVEELIPGLSLDAMLATGPLSETELVKLGAQLCEGLAAAHEQGIIHRDLKPGNIRVTPDARVKVLDFGLAKVLRTTGAGTATEATASLTETQIVSGTLPYMAPEQLLNGDLDARTDIWAAGGVLYEMATGRRPFPGSGPALIDAILHQQPVSPSNHNPKLSRGLETIILKCLEKEPGFRYQSTKELRVDLLRVQARPGSPVAVRRRSSRRRIHALAVLPLNNLPPDPEQDYFADGMTEALIAELAQIHALRVISRTSAMHYKGTTKTLPEIASELGVDGIVEGSVMRVGERLRITAQLIDAASDRHLWGRSYERDVRDVLGLQGEVARAIADEIQVKLTPQERARLARPRPVNLEAHEVYMRGRFHWARVHPQKSIEYLQQAVAIQPDYALAYAGIANAYCMLYGGAMQALAPSQIVPVARAAAVKALEVDDNLSEAHVSLARLLFWHDRDAAGAERELRRALEVNPNCEMSRLHYGILLADLRRDQEAVAELQKSLQLDPVSCWNSAVAGVFLTQLGEEEAGKQQLQKAIELDPTFFFTWSALSFIHCDEGKFVEAVAEAQEGVRLSAGLPVAKGWEAYALGMAGRQAEALAITGQLEQLSCQRYVPGSARAWAYLGVADYERALQWLETGYEQRDSWLPHLRLTRAFKPLDSDQRFQHLLRRLNLLP